MSGTRHAGSIADMTGSVSWASTAPAQIAWRVAAEQRHRTTNAQPHRNPLRKRQPAAIVDAFAPASETRDSNGAGEEAAENGERPEKPEYGSNP